METPRWVEPFDPLASASPDGLERLNGFTEASAWQYLWCVCPDIHPHPSPSPLTLTLNGLSLGEAVLVVCALTPSLTPSVTLTLTSQTP